MTDLDPNQIIVPPFIKTINEVVICVDSAGKIALVNPAAEKLLGAFLTDLVGKSYQDVLHFVQGSEPYLPVEKALEGKIENFSFNTQLVSKVGTYFIAGSASPIYGAGNKKVGVTILFRDTTIDREKDEEYKTFVSTAAHNIRTPLAIIKSGVSLLTESAEKLNPDQIKETLAAILPAVGQLENLVNDFLNIARIEQGRVVLVKETFDIAALTQEVVVQFNQAAQQKHLYLNHESGDSTLLVHADRAKTKEILVNLVSNAVKYTLQGGITINHANEGASLVTRIVDSGAGIPLDYQSLLFHKFHQVGTALKSGTAQSTGLGLYIAKKFALLQGGDLILEKSEPTRGTTFAFSLPSV